MSLRNLFRRQAETPTLRERAAELRASLPASRPQQTPVPVPDIAPEAAQEPATKAAGNQPANDDTTERSPDEEVEAIAGLEFGAYDLDTPLGSPQEWTSRLSSHAMMLHIADRTLRMSKPQTMAFIRDAGERDPETPKAMLHGLEAARETLEGWSNLLGLARARYIVAASAACTEPPAQTEALAVDPVLSEPVEIEAAVPADLADACLWAVRHRSWIDRIAERSPMTDADLDVEIAKVDAVICRAIAEPSTTPREIAAKAALALEDYERFVFTAGTKCDDGERIVHTVLREVAALADTVAVSEFHGIDFGPDTHIAELAAEFCRIYVRHAVKDRAHMAGDLTEAEWLPSYRATVALMEKLEATQPKTLLGTALKSLGAIGMAGWNARADGSTDGMDVWERVGVQFQDALMADALAPISIAGPDLVGLVNFQAASMDELHAVYDMANEVSAFAYALVSTGRGSVQDRHSYDGRLTPAGNLMLWVAEALSSVEDAAYNEIKRRKPTTRGDQETRLRVLASLLIANGDHDETAAFARELLAFAGE